MGSILGKIPTSLNGFLLYISITFMKMDISMPLQVDEEYIRIIECILSSKTSASTPAEICRLTGMSRRKVWHRLNVLLKSGLVSKEGKGRYKVTARGKLLYNLLNALKETDNIVWTSEGFYEININNLKAVLSEAYYIDDIYREFSSFLDKTLGLQGVFSIEYLIILLCHYLLSNGEESICKHLTRNIVYVPNIHLSTTQAWFEAFYRKMLENSIQGNSLPLIKNGILYVDGPRYVNEMHAIGNYKRALWTDASLSEIGWVESVVKVEELDDLKGVETNEPRVLRENRAGYITINVDEEYFIPELNDRVRKLASQHNVSLIVKLKQNKILSDDLIVTSILNDTRNSIEVLFAKHNCYGDNLITKDGYVLYRDAGKSFAALLTVSEVNLERLEMHKLHELLFNDGLATIYNYAKNKAKRVNIREDRIAIHNYINLKGIKGTSAEYIASFLKRMRDELTNNFDEKTHLGLSEAILEPLSYIERYPPLRVKVTDAFDLKMNVLKFTKMKYPLLSVAYGS